MSKTARLDGDSEGIKLEFVDHVATPRWLMRLAIKLHLRGVSLADTVSILDDFGFDRARSTVHNWVQKADLDSADGRDPEKIALDETVVKIDGEQHWLYAAVEPETNAILHVKLYSSRNTAATKMFLRVLEEKHAIDDAEFFVEVAPWLKAGLFELGMHFQHETHGDRNPVERVFQEVKRRTEQSYNTFSHVDPETAESWLQALAWSLNRRI